MEFIEVRNIYLALLVTFLPTLVSAGTNSYQCLINEMLFLQQDGSLKRPPIPYLIGQRFSVDRHNGRLTGPEPGFVFGDSAYKVLSLGNTENSFVLTISSESAGDGVHFAVVRIEEFSKDKEKPFVVLDGAMIVSGICL